jgi:hypothetical protein
MDIEEFEEEPAKVPTLIRTYGEYWSPELVDWSKSKLLAKQTKNKKAVDFNVYDERGVYVLFKDYVPVYVGKAFRQSIGRRLQLHRESRRKGSRWDSFSWFGLKGFKANGELRSLNKVPSLRPDVLIETLEALLIVVIDPKLNSRREALKGAMPLYQSHTYRPKDIDQRLTDIESHLASLLSKSSDK